MSYNLAHGKVTAHENKGCWICSIKVASFNAHHIIPRNAGGTKGPQVQICSECHDGLHHAAHLNVCADDYFLRADAKQNWRTLEAKQRASFLIDLVLNAERIANKSDNKTTAMTLKLTGETDRKLVYLSRRLKLSKHETIVWLINNYVPAGGSVR